MRACMRQLNSKAYLEHFAIPVDLMLYCVGQDTQVNISGKFNIKKIIQKTPTILFLVNYTNKCTRNITCGSGIPSASLLEFVSEEFVARENKSSLKLPLEV